MELDAFLFFTIEHKLSMFAQRPKGQSAFELMLIFMVGVSLLTPAMLYAMSTRNNYAESYGVTAGQNAVDRVTEAADVVFLQGPPAKIQVTVYIPDNVASSYVGDRTVMLKLRLGGGMTDLYSAAKENVSGAMPTSAGLNIVTVESMGTYVRLS
jgi:hypothetical protein